MEDAGGFEECDASLVGLSEKKLVVTGIFYIQKLSQIAVSSEQFAYFLSQTKIKSKFRLCQHLKARFLVVLQVAR